MRIRGAVLFAPEASGALLGDIGGAFEPVELRLRRPAAIEGVVTGADGVPIAGARVRWEPDTEVRKAALFAGVGDRVSAAVTDAAGRFRIAALEPTRGNVSASVTGFMDGSRTGVVLREGETTVADVAVTQPAKPLVAPTAAPPK